MPFEHEPATVVVLAEQWHAGEEDEIEPAAGIRDDEAGVHREVHVDVILMTGPPQFSKTPPGLAVDGVLRDQGAMLRLADEDRAAGVFDRGEPVEHEIAERDASDGATRQAESTQRRAAGEKDLHAGVAAGCVRDEERAIRGEIERGRIQHATLFSADLDQLGGGIEAARGDVDRMRTAVEDEVVACRRLLTAGEILEAAGDVRRKRGDG